MRWKIQLFGTRKYSELGKQLYDDALQVTFKANKIINMVLYIYIIFVT